MRLTQLIEALCEHLALNVYMEFDIKAKDGTELKALCLIPDFGAEKGMLVFTKADIVQTHGIDIIEQGYGYTALSDDAVDRGSLEENLSAYIEMFEDWGWTGKAIDSPVWVHSENHSE